MQAIAEDCGTYTADKLNEMKEQLLKSAAVFGVSAEQVSRMFEARYEIARSRIAMLEEADRSDICKQMEILASVD